MVRSTSEKNDTEVDNFSVNINNSNDFNRVLNEIKLKEFHREKSKKGKQTRSKVKARNGNDVENDMVILNSQSDKSTRSKRILSQSRGKGKLIQDDVNGMNAQGNDLYDTPVFPQITSLILYHEKENNNSESSSSIKHAINEKIERHSSNHKMEKHTIYDIYEKTLKKLSIEDESDILKESDESNFYFNMNKSLDKRKSNINFSISNFSNNTSDVSSSNLIPAYRTEGSKMEKKMNHQNEKDTKLRGIKHSDKDAQTKQSRHHSKEEKVHRKLEQLARNGAPESESNIYYDERAFNVSHMDREHHSCRNGGDSSNEEGSIRGMVKGKKIIGKEQGKESNKYENKCKSKSSNTRVNLDEEPDARDAELPADLLRTNELKSSGNEYLTQKERDYLNVSNPLSTGNLHECGRGEMQKGEMGNEKYKVASTKGKDQIVDNYYDNDVYDEKETVRASLKDIPEINTYHSLNSLLHKRKKYINGRTDENYATSEMTTTDSECSIDEKLNMGVSYDDFKNKKQSEMLSVVQVSRSKEKLLKVVNSEQILNIRKILRVMREFYIGFIGLQLIYFITYLLFGNNSVYLIQIVSISCTFFSLLDANYHGYLLNGFIDLCIAVFLNIAILEDISGFKSLKSNDVLKNITLSNVVFLYFFSAFSFLNGYFIHKLHSMERRNIKHVIRSIESKAEQAVRSGTLATSPSKSIH
ncbi:conserved Plasmodium protein, unknown function [Plasmodium knowlesi strain H]|uniref:Basal complex transmembrane protein 1 n=3 Tax=Plasmodium knowlesi TaxID=5850 RepID=A0A5K1UX34_PLAKH|nr:basal complex transmembrane protein 1, putative [Plasmodium knowlesi strain H]OTN64742.1 Uncharacterized protein PKNOH_S130205000 [Plasmodium knowlesi]CAA9989210.1 basal complex transmembrane protein 1, putative [Plasmodium knowlesi strain H]SBO27239.1 conserved Plasmodium protein, unknown function [Plasmodium knowlesi strain H]SBO27434.1 conserved Plasmodium protein, unknown function [Plasmodium knowlesi strain H]VVS78684.1 basal complex transmembrane protein 1, putative [Plasmodium knowle|eukprot:XP_002261554.1 hypothetical protein, conserved in Plasmodium species [Plasmodium knowlesi strain H]